MSAVAGRSVPGREPVPACSGQPDRLRAARGGEQSPASWHGRRRGVPAQVPGVEPGEEVQEGQEVTRGSLFTKVFFWFFWRHNCPLQFELGASRRRHHRHHLITCRSTCKSVEAAYGALQGRLPGTAEVPTQRDCGKLALRLRVQVAGYFLQGCSLSVKQTSSSPGPLLLNGDSRPHCPRL